jgi:choline dehydrogenase-like flavoprotein
VHNLGNPDVVIVGGGIGGSALATVLAREGIAAAIIEKSTVHVDQVRGEWIAPWGVAETQRLGLYDLLLEAGGHRPAQHIGFGDDADEAAARAHAVNFAAFEGAGLKPPLCKRRPLARIGSRALDEPSYLRVGHYPAVSVLRSGAADTSTCLPRKRAASSTH